MKGTLLVILFTLLAAIAFGLVWFFTGGSASPVGAGWYLFSFAAGLSMIILPCTLPLAFVIVPLSMGKGIAKGFLIALAFGVGVAITLSMYGLITAAIGKTAIEKAGADLETVKNWMYFIAGLFAYLFALGELKLINFRMPSYSGAFPGFIQKQKDVWKALLLGLFLGNIGVGCPHPATPVILTRIAVSGDIFYGWLLFFVHAIGRILPLLFLAILGILGVNALSGLVKNKEKIERATGWGMVFVAGFILVLGLFSHDWWVISGQHTYLEELTQEERFTGILAERLNVSAPHAHGLEEIVDGRGLFGLPIEWGTRVMLFLWILPLFWYYWKKKKLTAAMTDSPDKEMTKRTLPYLFWNFVTLSLLLVIVFGYYLPFRFLAQAQGHGQEMMEHMDGQMTSGEPGGHASLYHEETEVKEGITVNMNVTPANPKVGEASKLDFFVNLKPENKPVPESELEIQHEKKMHVIGARKDLNEFFHIHPVSLENPAILSVNHTFQKPGDYKIWSEIKYRGENHAFGHPIISLAGLGPTFEPQREITTNKIIGNYQITIDYHNLALGQSNHIDILVKDLVGRKVELQDFLGEKIHLTAISEDLSQFIHTHPQGHGEMSMDSHSLLSIPMALANGAQEHEKPTDEDHVGFVIPFKKAGFYKIFAQFRPTEANLAKDEALLAEFWVKVDEKSVATISPKIKYTAISIIFIIILSLVVKKYITVPKVIKQ
ncbi:MAG: hypothetical protein HYT13_03265 [Candidatus Liptonbacteria bacterium]|nr:hypothetical protein [Candidatus Liptonbacteria bacterium]